MKSFSGLDIIAVVFKMVDLDRVWVAHPQWDQTWVKSPPPSLPTRMCALVRFSHPYLLVTSGYDEVICLLVAVTVISYC